MNRKACVESMIIRRVTPGEDGFVLLELGERLTHDVANDLEQLDFATGRTIRMLEAVEVTPPSDLDAAVIAYLLDLDPPTS